MTKAPKQSPNEIRKTFSNISTVKNNRFLDACFGIGETALSLQPFNFWAQDISSSEGE